MTHTQGAPSAPLDSPSSAQERVRLLQQVAQFANAVMRLSHKMHQTGRLSPGEHDLLHSHMSLLDSSVQQLHPSTSCCGYLLHATTQLTKHQASNASDVGGDHQVKKKEMIASTSSPSTTCKIEKKRSRRRLRREFDDKTCQHCQSHYTSQWRTGPAGPSTLCNACGIRYARQVRQVGQHTATNDTAPHIPPPPARTSVHYLLN